MEMERNGGKRKNVVEGRERKGTGGREGRGGKGQWPGQCPDNNYRSPSGLAPGNEFIVMNLPHPRLLINILLQMRRWIIRIQGETMAAGGNCLLFVANHMAETSRGWKCYCEKL
jgi:hypothetical protein